MLYLGKKLDDKKLWTVFRLIAGENLHDCTFSANPFFNQYSSFLTGDNVQLTEEILANAIIVCTGEPAGNTYSLQNASLVGAMNGKKGRVGSIDVEGIIAGLGKTSEEGNEYENPELGGKKVHGIDFDDDDEEYGDSEDESQEDYHEEDTPEPEEYYEEESEEEPEEEPEEQPQEEEPEEEKPAEDAKKETICRYYSAFYTATVVNLLKKYSAMFESGYEVNQPDGVLCNDGLVKVVSGKRKIYEMSIATTNIYNLIKGHLPIVEKQSRSIVKIGNDIWESYNSSRQLLYFPNKMLEFAYGLEAPTGENQDSVNTYNRHAQANSWGAFKSGELTKSIHMLCKGLLYGFVYRTMQEKGIEDFRSPAIANNLKDYMNYVEMCMSVCFLFTEYKFDKVAGEGQLSKFTLRVCDPTSKMLSVNLTESIIEEAFLRNNGKDAYTYQNRVEPEAYMIEYAHEFNHSLAQATPLFAYKALQALIRDGKSISWDNLILGKGEDGKILKCGKDGFINLATKLLHFISAGSRAGKGVMTLNFIASALASRKKFFYIDRKPDMASILKYICNVMYVVNGGGYDADMDAYNQWSENLVAGLLRNVPKEVYDVLDVGATWNELGDVFYMRAMMLVLGIIVGRASGKGTDPAWGGKEGITLIVDEFSNFQMSYRTILNKFYAKVPDIKMSESRADLEKGKITQADFDAKYNDKSYYALAYVNALAASLEFLDIKGRAGFDVTEVGRSDIIVIGQHLKDQPVNIMSYARAFEKASSSQRYQTKCSNGMKGTFHSEVNTDVSSVPLTMLSFHSSGADVFLGRNDQGYLAAGNDRSKAFGRLDDKASNFAYNESLTKGTLAQLNSGNEVSNIQLASNFKYFKPYLILNDGAMDSSYVRGVVNRCQINAGISEEELIEDNKDPENPNAMHKAIGLLEYIKMAGVTDYEEVMGKGAIIAQNVVSALGYPGTWLEFICDLRPEWIFTIKDIENIAQGRTPALSNPATNPILKEWVEFNPQRFGEGYVDPEVASANEMDEFLLSDDETSDYSDPDKTFKEGDSRLNNVWDDDDYAKPERKPQYQEMGEDEEFDLFDEDEEESYDDPGYDDYDEPAPVPISPKINETGFANPEVEVSPEMQYYMDLVETLQQKIAQLTQEKNAERPTQPRPKSPREQVYEQEYEQEYESSDYQDFDDKMSNLDYEDEVDSLSKMVAIVSESVVRTFGGLNRFHTLKVVGGSIVVNNCYYRCNVKNMYATNVPYDIRRKLNSGNVAELFNFGLLLRMNGLRKLVVDSTSFMYDYVCSEMGIEGVIDVDVIFKALPKLQELVVGKEKFTRQGYKEQVKRMPNGDMFYKVKRSTQIADASESFLKKINSGAWSFTKNIAKKKNMNILLKSAGVLAGTAASASTLIARGGMAAGRAVTQKVAPASSGTAAVKRNLKGFMSGMKDLFGK